MHITAIILAGGKGKRFGSETPKQLVKLSGKPIIEYSIMQFQKNKNIDDIYIVSNTQSSGEIRKLVYDGNYTKVKGVIVGGETRQESSYTALYFLKKHTETTHVLIHDSVRPFVDDNIINKCVEKLRNFNAIDVCIPSTDTLVKIKKDHYNCQLIDIIPDRSIMRRGQTPQAFKLSTILEAHELALKYKYDNATDDCSLVKHFGLGEICVIDGSEYNIKITTPIDLYIAEKIFQLSDNKQEKLTDKELETYFINKNIVVFGGNTGIGKSICDIANKFGAKTHPLSRMNGVDVTIPGTVNKSLKNIHETHGKIDVVIFSSAVMHKKTIEDTSYEEMSNQILVNLFGAEVVAKESVPYLVESGGALVFFTSSSYTHGREGYATYSATKAGVVNLMQALSEELDGTVRVVAINPQRTKTKLRYDNFGKEDEKTLLTPERVALDTISAIATNKNGIVIDVSLN